MTEKQFLKLSRAERDDIILTLTEQANSLNKELSETKADTLEREHIEESLTAHKALLGKFIEAQLRRERWSQKLFSITIIALAIALALTLLPSCSAHYSNCSAYQNIELSDEHLCTGGYYYCSDDGEIVQFYFDAGVTPFTLKECLIVYKTGERLVVPLKVLKSKTKRKNFKMIILLNHESFDDGTYLIKIPH
jgi:hypothetical protein